MADSRPGSHLEPIAIVGIGCRFPGAHGPEAFWRLLRDGVDAITEVPPDRFDAEAVYDPRPATPGKIVTRWGGFLDRIDEFDADFFGISPREAERMDPQQRLLLEATWEALEDAGQVPAGLPIHHTGVYVGLIAVEYEDLLFEDPTSVNAYSIVGSGRSSIAGRLSYALGLQGPSLALDTACSSSLVAIHLACQSLRSGECRVALAGGVNLVLLPKYTVGYSQAGMLSPDGRCKAFDARADGFVRSEGAAMIVLKPLSQAQADGDPIYALIRGSAVNNDGRSGGLLMTPSQPGQEAVLRAAYAQAGISPGRVQYVEAHGTGTSVGDPVETRALGAVLGVDRSQNQPCRIGSVKTNIGHTEGAAGVAGVIKVALALKHKALPPSLHCLEPNPNIPWESLPLAVQRELSAWPEHEGPALAGVSSFGIAGTNAHMVLEEAPEPAAPVAAPDVARTPFLLPLSAHTRDALDTTARAYLQLFSDGGETSLADLRDLCYTASVRRTHHDYRMALVASDPTALAQSLEAALREDARPGLAPGRRVRTRGPKIVFVCPGQGGQWFGMARQLMAREPLFRATLEACDQVMRQYVDWSLLDELQAAEASSRLKEGMEEIDVLQPALFAIQIALAALWRSWGIEPDAVVGHSMGEVAAAYIAGALSLDDAARVICLRSRLMRTVSGQGGMAVTDLSWEQAERALLGHEGRVAIAAANGPSSTVLSGELDALTALLADLERQKVFCRLVRVDVASHSPQMDPLRVELLRLLDGMRPRRASLPIYSTVSGVVSDGLDMDAAYWMRNLRQPVLFYGAVRQLLDDGHDTFVELSPHPTLIGAVQQTLQRLDRDGSALPSFRRGEEERAVLLETLGTLYTLGCVIDWTGLYPEGGRCVPLPRYAWQHEHFWLDDGAAKSRRAYAGTSVYRGETRPANFPLLGQHISSAAAPGIHLWETDLSVQHFPYLADHRVQGKIVLPAAAYVEIALEAAREAFGPCELEQLRFDRALFLTEDGVQRVQVAIAADSPGAPQSLSFQLFTKQDTPEADAEESTSAPSWTQHASGTIRVAGQAKDGVDSSARETPEQLRARCGEEIAAGQYYQSLRGRGLDYGPAFQGIQQVWRCDGEAIARLQPPASVEAGAGAYLAHPALLDACFQALLAALPRKDAQSLEDDVYLPVEIESLRVVQRLRTDVGLWCHTLAGSLAEGNAETRSGDVYVLDDEGQVLLEARGLKIRRLEPATTSAGDDEDIDSWFYQVEWQEAPPPRAGGEESTPAKAPGRWLIFADASGVGQTLGSLLEAESNTCIMVFPGWSYARLGSAHYQINPAQPEDFRRLLADTCGVEEAGYRGIAHLWSLDAPPPEATSLASLQTSETLGATSVLHLVQALSAERRAESPRLWLITGGAQPVGAEGGGDVSVAQAPLLGLARVLPHEHPELRCARVDVSGAPQDDELRALATTLLADEREDEIALRGGTRYVPRLVRRRPETRETAVSAVDASAGDDTLSQFGQDDPFHVEITRVGILDNLTITRTNRRTPGSGQVEIHARAGGLNFMDVMRAMGIYPGQPAGNIPLGLECAGTVQALGEAVKGLQVGDEVIGITHSGGCCLSRFVTTEAALVIRKPAALSFEEAATLPIAFLTASYALEHLARVAAGERVLIHAASGGVGLAAVQLAQRAGAEVFATAGSEEKRQFLRSLGVRHVMDSRSLAFADEVMELTDGLGVDVVLNSLAGEAIPRSLSTLRGYGRFIEIGKKDIYGDARLDLSPFRNNLSYFAVDVDRLIRERPLLVGSILRDIGRRVEEGALKPLPTRTFPIAEVTDAFRYFAQAKHIGKVAVTLSSRTKASVSDGDSVPSIHADATYLITGGLGGLGLTVARWMVDQGARYLVLTGRGAPSSAAEQAVEELRGAGARVRVERADVAREADVARVLNAIAESMPPLRGVIHAAGVLDDGILLQLDQQRLWTVMAPKVYGAWNLHRLTGQHPLDFFVLFSSAATLIGSPGQGNYTAANAFLDALAHYRRAHGLPALSINWGAWSEVGLAVRPDRGGRLAQRGVRSFSPERGIEALSRLLAARAAQVAVMPFDAQQWRRFYPGADASSLLVRLLAEVRAAPAPGDHRPAAIGSPRPGLLSAEPAARRERMQSYLAEQVAKVLRLTASKIDADRPLNSLGLDSLMAVELRNRLEADLAVTVSVVELLQGPSIATLAGQLVRQLADADAEAVQSPALEPPLSARPAPAAFPLSYGQRAMWFLYQLAPESAAYNVAFVARIEADLDVVAWRHTFQALMDRHPILRTTFSAAHGAEPTQHVHERMEVAFLLEDASTWTETDLNERLVAEANRPFDLERGPLLRVAVYTRPAGDYTFLFTAHHIVVDFWSMVLMMEELRELYAAATAGRASQLPPGSQAQYADFVEWQRELLAGPRGPELWDYWRTQLAGASGTLDLPTDYPRPPVQTYRGISRAFGIDPQRTEQLKQLAQAHGTTLSTVLLAAYQVLLARYSGQQDLIVGSPMAGRSRAEFEEIVGYFVNPVPLRARLSDDPTFAAFLDQARETMEGALEHQDYPFPLLVERLHPVRDPARSPVFQAVFTFQKPHRHAELAELVLGEAGSRLRWGELALESLALEQRVAQFDLTLMVVEAGGGISASLEANADLFDAATVARLAGHFSTLLAGIAANPLRPVSALPLLADDEQRRMLVEWNATQTSYPGEVCLPELFEAQVARMPDAVALVFEDQQLTYRELNERANHVAHTLRRLGVGPEDLVAVCVERSPDMVAALLGVLKAGGAYVPLDPTHPRERIAYTLQDARPQVILTQAQLAQLLPEWDGQITLLDSLQADGEGPAGNPPRLAGPENLAYVMYTSGSTGRPKGVMIPHRALVNFLNGMQRQLNYGQDDVFLAVTSLSFDIAGLELYGPLVAGARVEVVSREVAGDGGRLADRMAASRTTIMQATPATWRMLLAAGWQGSPALTMLCGGEALQRDLAQQLLVRGSRLWNLYGPTETTIWSTVAPISAGEGPVPIGRPIANTQLYVLDAQLQPVPAGVPGELYIGGLGVARGYLNRPDLTAERFVPDPFSQRPGALLYRTGDQVRYRADGTVEYRGRFDHQVKIRGYRIELGEIEATLLEHPVVHAAVVVAREDHIRELRLVAYVVPGRTPEPAPGELRDHLLVRLPEYMVPSVFVRLDTLPLTPNGKVDRQALPAPDFDTARLEGQVVAPRTPTEEVLALVWSQVLGIDRVGADDNFFALGGHSLSATQVASRVRDTFHVELAVRALFEKPTLAGLAEHIDALRQTAQGVQASAVRPLPRSEGMRLPLSFAQQRLWFLNQLEPDSIVDNVPQGFRLLGQLDVVALERALDEIVRRHETLRTCFPTVDGEPMLVVSPQLKVELPVVDLRGLTAGEGEMELRRRAAEEVRRPFDLSRGPLFRACLLRASAREHVLVVTAHHITTDGWSFGVFLGELVALYTAFSRGEPSPLPDPPLQFADFAGWQRAWLQGESLDRQLAYWRERLAGAPALIELPTDRPRPPVQTYRGAYRRFVLSRSLTEELTALSRREGATLYMTLVAALDTLLHRYTAQDDIVVGSAVAGRVRPEVEALIGPFFNILALRSDLSGNPTFGELLGRVREVALGAYAHQELPFEKLVEELQPDRDLSYDPLVQVVIHLHNMPLPTALALPGLELQSLEVDTGTVKSDLLFNFLDTSEGLACILGYNTDLFDAVTIERLESHLRTLMEAIVRRPDTRVDDLPMLTPAERNQLVSEWNATEADFPRDACLHTLVEAQVARSPDAIAVIAEQGRLTYADLDRRAAQLARRLRALGVGPEVRVGLCMERSVELVVGLLGVLKAGGAYVPLDPASPPARLAAMLADAQPPVLLTQTRLLSRLPAAARDGRQVLCLDDESLWTEWGHLGSADALPRDCRPEHIAYVIYTSGSTGTPKGVEIPHRGIVNRLRWMQQTYGLTPGDRVLQKTPYTFDVSVWEFFWPLLSGATLVVARPEGHRDNAYLAEVIEQQAITTLHFVPSMLAAFLDQPHLPERCASVRRVVCSGEALPVELMERFFNRLPGVELHNLYGPTEASVDVSAWACRLDPQQRSVPIGRPIANTQLYVLDAQLQPVPVGVPGELYIGGVGLARGYLHRPELTAERFVPDPFSSEPGARLYRTGDLARYRADGAIDFLGRLDTQVKLRGNRIELGEVEAALLDHPAVRAAVVLARHDHQGELRLVAYVVPAARKALDHANLRSFLAERLPDYMLPSSFVNLRALTLTSSGKVDRNALPAPDWARRPDAAGSYTAPRTALEREVASIFAEMLGVEQVGAHDSFFELGGHSLLAMRLVFRLRDVFRVDLPLRSIFGAPTVAGLAQALEHARGRQDSEREAVDGASRTAETLADMLADTALDPDITPAEHSVPRPGEPRHVFLTGATGFLGAFLLAELVDQTQARIHCLVRGRNPREARERLRRHLVSYELWNDSIASRISVVVGDLAQPRLGLSAQAFETLARKVDVVYHAGAQVNFVYAYDALRAANVRGTQDVLRLACLRRTKPLHYVSTLSVFSPQGDPTGRVIGEDDSLDVHLPFLADGYDQSKWVAEKLVWAARDRGLPVSIYRPGLVFGHSQTGVSNVEDVLCRAIKGSIQLGSLPEGPEVVRCAPVDYVSRAIVYLSLRTHSAGRTFHLVNPQETSINQIGDWLRSAGYRMRSTSFGAWRGELVSAAADSADNALYPLLPFLGDEGNDTGQLFASPRFDSRHTEEGLKGSGIVCPALDVALIQRCLAYLRRIGFIADLPTYTGSSDSRHTDGGGTGLMPAVSAMRTAARDD